MELSLYIKDKLVSGKRVAIPIMTHPGIELLGKRVLDAVTNGEIHYHAIRTLNECFPQSAACTTIMDLTGQHGLVYFFCCQAVGQLV